MAQNGLFRVLTDRRFTPIALSLFTHGLSQGMTVPFIALWILRGYDRGPGATAAYFASVALGGLVLNPVLGRLTDRTIPRKTAVVIAALLQGGGMAVLALRPPFWIVLTAAALLVTLQVQPPLFSLVNDHVGEGTSAFPRAATLATLRATVSASWVFGAPIGGLLLAQGLTWPFLVGALFNAGSGLIALFFCREARTHPSISVRTGHPTDAPVQWPQLLLFSLAVAVVISGNSAKMQAVPLYLHDLGLGTLAVGVMYAWMAFGEMVLMPWIGHLADRFPRRRVIVLGTLGGAVFFGAIAVVPHALTVIVAFPAVALMIAALYGVGIGYVQELDPVHPGLGGGLFFGAQAVGMATGGPLIAYGERTFGFPAAFGLPAAAVLVGALLLLATHAPRTVARAVIPPTAGAATQP